MRNLDECRAEIFRLGNKKIKKRKKRRVRVLSVCIPLCLCLAVCSVTVLPAMLPAGMKDVAENENAVFDDALYEENMGSLVCSYIEVEIQDAGQFPEHYEKVTDKVEVTKIFSSIHSLFVEVDGVDQGDGEAFVEENADRYNQQTDVTSKLTGYRITFSTDDGSQTVYNLSNNTLLNVNSGEKVILIDAQVAELKVALGISE